MKSENENYANKYATAFTYWESWILIEPSTGKHFNKQAVIESLSLEEVGISNGMHLAFKLLNENAR